MNLLKKIQGSLSVKQWSMAFTATLLVILLSGLYLMWQTQDRIQETTRDINTQMLPLTQKIENARRNLELQIQEVVMLFTLNPNALIDLKRSSLLKLPRQVESLYVNREQVPYLKEFENLYRTWVLSVDEYNYRVQRIHRAQDAIPMLQELRRKTALLERSLKRSFSINMIELNHSIKDSAIIWSFLFLIAFLLALAFALAVKRWIAPLEKLNDWINSGKSNKYRRANLNIIESELAHTPKDIQKLLRALKKQSLEFVKLKEEIVLRGEKNADNEKSLISLFIAISQLIRRNEELLKEVIQKEKLASMGEMAAQLAHEIKNPLNSMNLKLELLLDELNQEQKSILLKVVDEIDRLDALTESHLRKTKARLSHTELSIPIEKSILDCIDFLKPELQNKNIQLKYDIPSNHSHHNIKDSILRAVLINLIKNSEEALDDSQKKKVISIALSKEQEEFLIRVSDNGKGFPEELRKAPFKSFKTTKPEGSGLGLYTAQKMLKAYNGFLSIDPPGEGFSTQITIHLPELKVEREIGTYDLNC